MDKNEPMDGMSYVLALDVRTHCVWYLDIVLSCVASYPSYLCCIRGTVNPAIVSAWHLVLRTSLLYRQRSIVSLWGRGGEHNTRVAIRRLQSVTHERQRRERDALTANRIQSGKNLDENKDEKITAPDHSPEDSTAIPNMQIVVNVQPSNMCTESQGSQTHVYMYNTQFHKKNVFFYSSSKIV